jgi:hypothetical protein
VDYLLRFKDIVSIHVHRQGKISTGIPGFPRYSKELALGFLTAGCRALAANTLADASRFLKQKYFEPSENPACSPRCVRELQLESESA